MPRSEGRKRKGGGVDGQEVAAKLGRAGAGSLLSPPLFPLYTAQHAPAPQESLASPEQGAGGGQEDEWKNIQVMLNCILGMVEKTQSALTILQQRQTEAASLRTTEEAVAEVQTRANLAIGEVKAAALEEIRAAKRGAREEGGKEGGQCWNCGRGAGETCSGCGLAR